MFEVMVKAVLERIPDYEVDVGGVHRLLRQSEHDRVGQASGHVHARYVPRDVAPDLEQRELVAGEAWCR